MKPIKYRPKKLTKEEEEALLKRERLELIEDAVMIALILSAVAGLIILMEVILR